MKKFFAALFSVVFLVYALGWFFCRCVYPTPHRHVIRQIAQEFELDPLLVGAMIFSESRYREKAVSSAGALGWMQVMPLTGLEVAREIGLADFTSEDLLNKETNLRIGCFYFAKLKRRLDSEDWLALAAYNAGEANIREWVRKSLPRKTRRQSLEFPETRRYVRKIEWLYLGLRLCRRLYVV